MDDSHYKKALNKNLFVFIHTAFRELLLRLHRLRIQFNNFSTLARDCLDVNSK